MTYVNNALWCSEKDERCRQSDPGRGPFVTLFQSVVSGCNPKRIELSH